MLILSLTLVNDNDCVNDSVNINDNVNDSVNVDDNVTTVCNEH